MSTIYYTASSLDGYIVDENGSLDWLVTRDIREDGPFAIEEFMAGVGSLVMGADTYEWILANHPGEWMYSQPSWVMTHRPGIVAAEHPVQTYAGPVAELHPRLGEAAAGKNVWVVGGGEVARQFVDAGLVDDMIVSYAPCTLGAGSRVLPMRSEWSLVSSAVNGDFVCAHWRRS
ncbi:dihydrofolate reductase family protein [Mycolicibacterium parafortuitum]|uniref:Bifunctional deaminase-reductase domain-containing protein [Geodermatophilus obscurus DSM] n=1 Tax=Mycolicibacterium parafortuitum TaxID=39692 RepID=A0A375YEJ0_MYCPF|nr:dihydrofolate reductase family protein [Mycolicibacterium parafortuitum]ORB30168.1 deaminase [Mycolicibacterium parafortuitum]SRX79510.1 bifunctional deaminase-reductase domain-containing protein [Geodermatophilus obscurus DSM] [Mycolicibacterium parafortuitum]